jgi:hypothetical protein
MIWLRLTMLVVYCTTFLLGVGIKLRWWHTRTFNWLHHALFAGIWLSVLSTALVGWHRGVRRWFAPLGVLLWMAPLPRFRAGGRMHQILAVGGLITLLGSLFVSGGDDGTI